MKSIAFIARLKSIRRRIETLLVIAIFALGGAVVSCQRSGDRAVDDELQNAEAGSDERMSTLQDSAAADSNAAVQVRLTEFAIEIPATIPAGTTTFNVVNQGGIAHSLKIEGNGVERELPAKLRPGAMEKMTVELEPGTYQVYCPVGDHNAYSMYSSLEVQG